MNKRIKKKHKQNILCNFQKLNLTVDDVVVVSVDTSNSSYTTAELVEIFEELKTSLQKANIYNPIIYVPNNISLNVSSKETVIKMLQNLIRDLETAGE